MWILKMYWIMMKLKKDLDKIKEIEKNVDIQNLINETNDYTYSF